MNKIYLYQEGHVTLSFPIGGGDSQSEAKELPKDLPLALPWLPQALPFSWDTSYMKWNETCEHRMYVASE